MDQACEYGDFLDGPFSKEHMLNQQPLTWHEQMLISWSVVLWDRQEKNRNDYSSSRMSLRMVWLLRSHQRALNGKQGYIYMYSYGEGRLQNLTWKRKSTANCDVTVIKKCDLDSVLSLCCWTFYKWGPLDVILKTFVLKPVINVCSFILTVN